MRAESDAAPQEQEAGRPLAPFGAVVRRHRRAAGFTQEELAERTGLTREAISLLERGARQRPHPYTVQALCAALSLSPADSALFAAAARASPGTPAPSMRTVAPASPLVGRVTELALIDRQLLAEGPAALVLAGEPGIGKSRLLAEAQARAAASGWTVLEGGCQRRGQDPYAPLVQAMERHLARLQPTQRRAAMAAQAAERARVVPSQRALVEALWMQARVAIQRQLWAEARDALDEGVALARRIQAPYAQGRLLHSYGQLQAALGEQEPARAHWEAALAIFQRLGARADAAAVQACRA